MNKHICEIKKSIEPILNTELFTYVSMCYGCGKEDCDIPIELNEFKVKGNKLVVNDFMFNGTRYITLHGYKHRLVLDTKHWRLKTERMEHADKERPIPRTSDWYLPE